MPSNGTLLLYAEILFRNSEWLVVYSLLFDAEYRFQRKDDVVLPPQTFAVILEPFR